MDTVCHKINKYLSCYLTVPNEQKRPGVLCLPERTLLAFLMAPSIHKTSRKYLEDYNNWPFMWMSAVLVTVLSALVKKGQLNTDKVPEEHKKLLPESDKYAAIEDVFNRICSSSGDYLGKLKKEIETNTSLFHEIQSRISIFIDRIDQAFSQHLTHTPGQTNAASGYTEKSYWDYAQLSLAEAAYKIDAINPHIKVYFSMRPEPLKDAEKYVYDYQNFRNKIQDVSYSDYELKEMYEMYIEMEQDKNLVCPEKKNDNPSLAFIGVSHIRHKYVKGEEEQLFDYIYRHTFGRPRDIMHMCRWLYESNLKAIESCEKRQEVGNR
jgi:hypothetical protein